MANVEQLRPVRRSLKDRVADMLNAALFKGTDVSVITSDGAMGLIKETRVFKGEIVVFTDRGEKTYRGSEVSDL